MSTKTLNPTRNTDDSGNLSFDGSIITYTSQHYGSFSVALSEIAVFGEFTTDNGPVIDDWFLVFVPRSGGEWFEASMYAEGIDQLCHQLSGMLGCVLRGRLAASADFASRIIWPVALADRPLFTSSPVTGSGFLRRFKLSVLPEVSHSLSSDIFAAIERSDS